MDLQIEQHVPKKKAGRRKINIEFIEDKSRRQITFSKRKAGLMKKAYELSTLTGTQALLLVASETGHVYTFATPKLQPFVTLPEGKNLIQSCLNAPDTPIVNNNNNTNNEPSSHQREMYHPSEEVKQEPYSGGYDEHSAHYNNYNNNHHNNHNNYNNNSNNDDRDSNKWSDGENDGGDRSPYDRREKMERRSSR